MVMEAGIEKRIEIFEAFLNVASGTCECED